MKNFGRNILASSVKVALISSTLGMSSMAIAEETEEVKGLEVIQVTARKRVENVQEVPIAVSALQGENLDVISSAGMDIRFINARIPSVSVESSFGRTFPRFYMRGLGNSDFDLNASQPVSLVVDDIVQENPILKGFPVFDVARVEALKGPQGTLFGRNTPAGLVKFDSVKPSQVFEGFASLSHGTHNTSDFRGAIGGGLTDELSIRISTLYQDRDNYIDNHAPGFEQDGVLGGYTDKATRIQFLYEGDGFNALFNYHFRDLDGEPIPFRANAIQTGTNDLVAGFDEEKVYHDAASRATQQVETDGASLKLEVDLDNHTFTSITGYESAEIYSRADVDGGYGCNGFGCPPVDFNTGPGVINLSSETADAIPDHQQITQEFRVTSNLDGDYNYQVGVFYFNEDLIIESFAYDTLFSGGVENGYVVQKQETSAWALFGSFDYQVNDKLSTTLGLRYSDDKKNYTSERFQSPLSFLGFPDSVKGFARPSDNHVSWDLSASYKYSDDVNLYARVADSFRAPSIQGRSLFAPGDGISIAESETILSFETGIKSDIMDGYGRVNASIFYFTMDDQQLTSVGGNTGNVAALVNADETKGYGFEIDSEFLVTDNLSVTASVSYNNTELNDDTLSIPVCASCTVTDPLMGEVGAQTAIIDGNSLPHAPEWIFNFTARYSKEYGEGEFYAYTDWSYRDEINFFLYESKEFTGKSLFEGGVKAGYIYYGDEYTYEGSLFVRNITDEQVAIGGVDFTNNTAIVNEGRFVGAEFKVSF